MTNDLRAVAILNAAAIFARYRLTESGYRRIMLAADAIASRHMRLPYDRAHAQALRALLAASPNANGPSARAIYRVRQALLS